MFSRSSICFVVDTELAAGRTWSLPDPFVAFFAFATAAITLLALTVPLLAQDALVVKSEAGLVSGLHEDGVEKFLGIPYAKPPVGELRWKNPVAPDPWTDVRETKKYGKFCAQIKELGDFANSSVDEDCLYLNVFAPDSGQGHPVMFWIHGGATTGMSDSYDGTALAREQKVVVVTINYRLGALGALVHPALDGGGATTHYGLRDQQFAMQWVRNNIQNFGGDPNNVTIFGESTGATDVLFHIISPRAKGLFQRAILQSPARYFTPLVPLADAEEKGKAFAVAVGCSSQTADCLRRLPVEKILAAQGSFGGDCCALLPIDDGQILTMSIYDAIRSGQFNQVPILGVTDHDENRWFQAFFGEVSGKAPVKADEYQASLLATYGDKAKAIEQIYPLDNFGSADEALAAVSSDYGAICQPRSFNIDASKFVPVYTAEFNDPNSPGILPAVSFPLLASHTHEIQYIFAGWRGVYQGKVPDFSPAQAGLAIEMRKVWARFAANGSLPSELPETTRDHDLVISLEPAGIKVINDFAKAHKCDFWNSIRGWRPVE